MRISSKFYSPIINHYLIKRNVKICEETKIETIAKERRKEEERDAISKMARHRMINFFLKGFFLYVGFSLWSMSIYRFRSSFSYDSSCSYLSFVPLYLVPLPFLWFLVFFFFHKRERGKKKKKIGRKEYNIVMLNGEGTNI